MCRRSMTWSALSSRGYHYEVLVNNAGFGIHGDFASGDIEQNTQLVTANSPPH